MEILTFLNYLVVPCKGNFAFAEIDLLDNSVLLKKVVDPYYSQIEWVKCREIIGKHWGAKNPHMLYCVKNDKIQNIQDFFIKAEEKLNLTNKKDKTIFYRTDKENITAIQIGKFWLTDEMRGQIFTIFLRCGTDFNGENFDEVIFGNKYFNKEGKNAYAISRFLEGNTSWTGPKLPKIYPLRGFNYYFGAKFARKTPEFCRAAIDKLLVLEK